MQIDPTQQRVRLSVRELAIFRNRPDTQGHGYSPWRASVGQQWHKTLEAENSLGQPDTRFEVNVEAEWQHRGWIFQLSGRMDQLLSTETGQRICEVKTIRKHLPLPDETLIEQYPEYFAQVSIYQALLKCQPEYDGQIIEAEVLFINIENGARQSVSLEASEYALFEHQLNQMLPFLEERRQSLTRINQAKLRPAFEQLRPGQAELIKKLHEAALQARHVLLQAPTGFGKTGIILEHTLKHMQRGLYERCIYLSSKSTGQIETIRQLKEMTGQSIRYIQMRNRSEHHIDSTRHTCSGDERCNNEIDQRWREADINASELFEQGTLELSKAQSIGAATGVCPYSLTKACLPFAEIWIGDSNYIFSPDSQAVFTEVQGFEPKRTLLIVDEAHNLPQRTADSLSLELSAADLLFAIEEWRANDAPKRLLAIANELVRWIDKLKEGNTLNSNDQYTGQDLCEDFAQQLAQVSFNYATTAPFALKLAWNIPDLAKSFNASPHQFLHWAPRPGTLAATCLDPSEWIAQCLAPFGGAILMSATLAPFDAFRQSCGLSMQSTTYAEGHAPWRDAAYDVAIDTRIDTRLRTRDRYYEATAVTVAQLCHRSPAVPVAVFFASYQYAANIQAYLEALHPELRVQCQPRGGDLVSQQTFIEEGLLTADALFLILGSSFSEGIDQLGGRIDHVMVVGPALPEVNQIQKSKMESYGHNSRELAFRDIYIQPAMRRIHQALGRIVRAPGQRARVLLHCKRFAETAYQDELTPEYQGGFSIKDDATFFHWLDQSDKN